MGVRLESMFNKQQPQRSIPNKRQLPVGGLLAAAGVMCARLVQQAEVPVIV